MKAILFADADSIHTYMNVRKIISEKFDEIVLVHTGKLKNTYSDYYKSAGIKLINIDYNSKYKISLIAKYISALATIKKLGAFDVCFVHFLSGSLCKFVARCCGGFKQIVSVYWGSDLLIMDDWKKKCQIKLLDKSDYIRAGELYSEEVFHKVFGEKYDAKLVSLDFLVNDDFGKELAFDVEAVEKKYGFKHDKIVVAIGYNGNKSQQHKAVNDEIFKIDKEILSRCQFLFLMTYSDMEKAEFDRYKLDVAASAQRNGLDYIIQERYLKKPEMLEIAKRTDIFIHFIKSDSYSGTFLEMLAEKAFIIKGEWLKYYEFDDCFIKNSNFTDLSRDFETSVRAFPFDAERLEKNRRIVLDKINNQKIKTQWCDFIDRILG